MGGPSTILAPPVRIEALSGLTVAGISLASSDGTLTMNGLCAFWMCVSMVSCFLMYYLGRFISPVCFKAYGRLSVRDRREWDVRYASMPHAFLCVWYAYILLWASDFFYHDGSPPNIIRANEVSHTALGISLGFFIVDFAISLKYQMGGHEMTLHHIGSIASVLCAILTGQGHMHTIWMLVTEFTTPFINLRWWLDKMDLKSTSLYFYNGLAMFFGWIIARILIFPPFFYVVYSQRAQISILHPISVFLLYVIPVILIVLNSMWFYKILKGVIKLLNPDKPKDKAKTS